MSLPRLSASASTAAASPTAATAAPTAAAPTAAATAAAAGLALLSDGDQGFQGFHGFKGFEFQEIKRCRPVRIRLGMASEESFLNQKLRSVQRFRHRNDRSAIFILNQTESKG